MASDAVAGTGFNGRPITHDRLFDEVPTAASFLAGLNRLVDGR